MQFQTQFHDRISWNRAVPYGEQRVSFTAATEVILVLRNWAQPKFYKTAARDL